MLRTERIYHAAAFIVLAAAVFLIGGALRWAVCVVSGLSIIAILPTLRSKRYFQQIPPLMWLILAATTLTAIQLVPLPAVLTRLLSPSGYELASGASASLGEEAPTWRPLSLDPAGSLVELAELVGYAAAAFLALRIAAERKGPARLASAVCAVAAALAITGFAHHLLGASRVFGIYQPRETSSFYLSPLINANHQAGLLAMASPLALGLATHERGRRRLVWLAVAALTIAACLLTRSRGAPIALGIGMFAAATALVLHLRRRGAESGVRRIKWSVTAPAIAIALCALTLVAYFSAGGLADELHGTRLSEFDDPTSKFAAWRSASVLAREHWMTGIGRGAFEAAFTRVHPASGFKTFSHAENEYLQAVIDWGVPGAAVLAFLVAWICIVAFGRIRETPLIPGAIGALVTVAAQSGVDYGLELPGVAMPTIFVLAIVTNTPLGATKEIKRRRAQLRAAGLGLAALAVVLAATPYARSLREDHEQLGSMLANHGDSSHTIASARDAIHRHPLDYHAPATLAAVSFAQRDKSATKFLNRALFLHPYHQGLHRLAARILLAAGRREQAMIEYALAFQYAALPQEIAAEVVQRFPNTEDALRAMPTRVLRPYDLAAALVALERPDLAVGFLQQMVAASPGNVPLLRLLMDFAVRYDKKEAALAAAAELYRVTESVEDGSQLGQQLSVLGRHEEAERILTKLLPRAPRARQIAIHRLLADIYLKTTRWSAARDSLNVVLDSGGLTRADLAGVHRKLAEVERAMGNPHQARWEEARATELTQEQPGGSR